MKIFSKKVDAIIVVEIDSCLKLANVELRAEPRVVASKIIQLKAGKNDEFIVAAIRDFVKEYSLRHKNAILNPCLKSLLIKRIGLPELPDTELPEAVRWKLKETSGIDPDKYTIDYRVISGGVKADTAKALGVICAAAETEELRQQVLLLKQAGLDCLAVNIPAFGYAKIVGKRLKQPGSLPQAVLHLDEDNCYIAFYKDNCLEFYRKIPASINKLKESLSVPLVTQKGIAQLGPEEIEEILFKAGIPVDASAYAAKMAAAQILSLIRADLERLAQEIKLSFAYYDSEFQAGIVKSIFIAGSAVKMPNLDKFLSKELRLDTGFMPENAGSLGLALDFKTAVNLLPYEFRTQKLEALERLSLRWVAFIAFLFLAVSYIFARAGVGILQKRLDAAGFELNVLSEIRQIKQKTAEFDSFSSSTMDSEFGFTQALKKISNLVRPEMFFSRLSINSDSASGAISGYLKLEGADPENRLTKFAAELEGSIYFKEANISSMKKEGVEGNGRLVFELTFKLE